MRWDGCVKLHEGCGGLCRWVEAVHTKGVGWQGECLACGAEELVVEAMLPLEGVRVREIGNVRQEELSRLEWDDHDDWEGNQARLHAEAFG